MKLKYVAIVLALLIVPLADATLQKPNWRIGDYWEYSGDYQLVEEFDFGNLTGEGNLTFSITLMTDPGGFGLTIEIVDVEIKDYNGSKLGCYEAEVEGNINGDFSLEGDFSLFNIPIDSIDGTFEVDINGFILFTTADLAIYETGYVVWLNLSTDTNIEDFIPGFNPNMKMEILSSFDPPLDFMKFPVNVGEEWQASSTATVESDAFYDVGVPTTSPVTFTFECVDKTSSDIYWIQTDFNPFADAAPSTSSDLYNVFWDASSGMIQGIRNSGGATQQILDIDIENYVYEGLANVNPTAGISFTPTEPKKGTNIFFESDSSDSDGSLRSWYWDFGDGTTSTQQNPSHAYSSSGTFTVSHTVMDNYGDQDTTIQVITIESSSGGTPGFEIILAFTAFALLVMWKRFR